MKDGLSQDVKRRLEEVTSYTEIHVFAFPGKPVVITYIFEGKVILKRTMGYNFPDDGNSGLNLKLQGMRGHVPVDWDPNYRPPPESL